MSPLIPVLGFEPGHCVFGCAFDDEIKAFCVFLGPLWIGWKYPSAKYDDDKFKGDQFFK
jgi:hypothetical protein